MDTGEIVGRPYRPRIIDSSLERALRIAGAVVVEGARASGKTMSALNAAASFSFLDDPETRKIMEIAPRVLLEGPAPKLLDEWQLAPELWNLVRRAVDSSADRGRFILTGSAVPADDSTRHTGAGRFLRLRQWTMTWWEKLGSPEGGVSLSSLFEGYRPEARLDEESSLGDVIALILQSGFPAMTDLRPDESAQLLRAYIEEVARTDVNRLANLRHEPEVVEQLIRALARSVASEVTYKTLASDIRSVAPNIRPETIGTYLSLLRRLFIVESQRAWAPRLRSRATLRTSPKLHLVDAALAAASLGANAQRLGNDLGTLGVLFESAVVHDLTAFASTLGGDVYHYRDSYGREMDAIVTLPDGRWGAVEVKLGGLQIPNAQASLAAAIGQIDFGDVGESEFRLILTGNGPTLTLEDGTVTCPLAVLRP